MDDVMEIHSFSSVTYDSTYDTVAATCQCGWITQREHSTEDGAMAELNEHMSEREAAPR